MLIGHVKLLFFYGNLLLDYGATVLMVVRLRAADRTLAELKQKDVGKGGAIPADMASSPFRYVRELAWRLRSSLHFLKPGFQANV